MKLRPLAFTILLTTGLGCASRDARPGDYAVRTVPTAEEGDLLAGAESALVGLNYSIAKRDAARGIITTNPVPVARDSEHSIRVENPLRKLAEVRIVGSGDTVKVHCKVIIQEQATENYRLLVHERGGDDVPGHHTAIDRDAATTPEQNSVWRTIRRDRSAEREILDRITADAEAP